MAIPLAAIPLALGAAQSAFGLFQANKGRNILNNTERPEYEIPEEIYSNLTQAQKMAMEGLPAEQKEQYLQNILRGTSTALSASASRKGGLSMVDDILRQETDAYSTMLSQDASARLANQRAVMAQRQNLADYKDKSFMYNQDEPYRQSLAEGQGLVGSGIQNVWGGLSGIGSSAMSMFNKNQTDNLLGLNGESQSNMSQDASQPFSSGAINAAKNFYNASEMDRATTPGEWALNNQSAFRLNDNNAVGGELSNYSSTAGVRMSNQELMNALSLFLQNRGRLI